jgi:hypothetical protein
MDAATRRASAHGCILRLGAPLSSGGKSACGIDSSAAPTLTGHDETG